MSNAEPNRRWDGRQWVTDQPYPAQPPLPAPYEQYQQPVYPQYRQPYPQAPYPQPVYQVYQQRQFYGPNGILLDKRDHSAQAVVAWVLTVLTGFYMLPWAIAATRGKSNAGAIGWITFLLGWTFVGWIIALVMACTAHQVLYAPNVNVVSQTGYYYGR